jgi:hypothetical protein
MLILPAPLALLPPRSTEFVADNAPVVILRPEMEHQAHVPDPIETVVKFADPKFVFSTPSGMAEVPTPVNAPVIVVVTLDGNRKSAGPFTVRDANVAASLT